MILRRITRPKSVIELLSLAGMSQRPFFYCGRGVLFCDLNEHSILYFYRFIEYGEHVGDFPKGAADAFFDMVMSLDLWAATPFMENLYRLELRGWQKDPNAEPIEDRVTLEKHDGEYTEQSMLGGFAAMLGTPDRDKDHEVQTTRQWKEWLCREVGRKVPWRDEEDDEWDCYWTGCSPWTTR